MCELVLFGCKIVELNSEGSSELEMANAAAEKLVQLIGTGLEEDEDNAIIQSSKEKDKKRKNQTEHIVAKSGKVLLIKPKKKKYRSIQNLYLETKPMSVYS
ncbi:hypothetical protein K7X08_022170 [Anisodus acutangulus]|uniref:Uncharacterized protein n=1 Tax=Anisodus acutangulus TaxID=402998 RepID=A0A9Q1QV19_9SOLA|nr:hypothetical protein K7X08_022170 [Anisodus acutangulus]